MGSGGFGIGFALRQTRLPTVGVLHFGTLVEVELGGNRTPWWNEPLVTHDIQVQTRPH